MTVRTVPARLLGEEATPVWAALIRDRGCPHGAGFEVEQVRAAVTGAVLRETRRRLLCSSCARWMVAAW